MFPLKFKIQIQFPRQFLQTISHLCYDTHTHSLMFTDLKQIPASSAVH